MSSSDLVRWGGLAAMAAGAVWVVSGILAIVYQGEHAPGTFADYLVEGTFAAGLLLTAAGMVGLHALQQENYGRIAWAHSLQRENVAWEHLYLGFGLR